jgi:hypothetical protein
MDSLNETVQHGVTDSIHSVNNAFPANNSTIEEANANEENSTTSSYLRRQSSGSFTAGSDSAKALTIISEMLERYNNMIETNTKSIEENASVQLTNFFALQTSLESVIDAINHISQRAAGLEETAQKNAEMLAAISNELVAQSNPIVHNRLDEITQRIEETERDIVYLKDCAVSSSESIQIIEGRLGHLEGRVSNIERLLTRHKNRHQNDVAAKMA